MPGLDVTDAVSESSFQDSFTVERRAEGMSKGRASTSMTTFRPNGVVAPAGNNDLERLPDDQRMMKTLVVVTQFRLRGPAPGFQPDVIVWEGDRFVVAQVEDFSGYGQGFIKAICTSMDSVDQPPHE